jgi:hypothetical protein
MFIYDKLLFISKWLFLFTKLFILINQDKIKNYNYNYKYN